MPELSFVVSSECKIDLHKRGGDVRVTILNALQTIVPARLSMQTVTKPVICILYGFYFHDKTLNMMVIDLETLQPMNAFAFYEKHGGHRSCSFRPFTLINRVGIINLDKAIITPAKTGTVTSSLKKWLSPGKFLARFAFSAQPPKSYVPLTVSAVTGVDPMVFHGTLCDLRDAIVVVPNR